MESATRHDHTDEPITVELAPLPRTQIGPFLLLGLDKANGAEATAAHCAERFAEAGQHSESAILRDLEWARGMVLDSERRLQADVTSLNVDTADRLIGRLSERYGAKGAKRPHWEPLEAATHRDDPNPTAVPDPAKILAAIQLPNMPPEAPAAASVLQEWIQEPLDPWALEITPHTA